jgi:hypothetical protein
MRVRSGVPACLAGQFLSIASDGFIHMQVWMDVYVQDKIVLNQLKRLSVETFC